MHVRFFLHWKLFFSLKNEQAFHITFSGSNRNGKTNIVHHGCSLERFTRLPSLFKSSDTRQAAWFWNVWFCIRIKGGMLIFSLHPTEERKFLVGALVYCMQLHIITPEAVFHCLRKWMHEVQRGIYVWRWRETRAPGDKYIFMPEHVLLRPPI